MKASDFSLQDQYERTYRLSSRLSSRKDRYVMLFFLPGAFTYTCQSEISELKSWKSDFEKICVEPVVISCDSAPVNANWLGDLGGVNVRMLADWNPHASVCRSYGAFDKEEGRPTRKIVLISPSMEIVWEKDVPVSGIRKMPDLFEIAKKITAQFCRSNSRNRPSAQAKKLPDMILYADERCGHCRQVLATIKNLGISDSIKILSPYDRNGNPVVNSIPTLKVNGKTFVSRPVVIKELLRITGEE